VTYALIIWFFTYSTGGAVTIPMKDYNTCAVAAQLVDHQYGSRAATACVRTQ